MDLLSLIEDLNVVSSDEFCLLLLMKLLLFVQLSLVVCLLSELLLIAFMKSFLESEDLILKLIVRVDELVLVGLVLN